MFSGSTDETQVLYIKNDDAMEKYAVLWSTGPVVGPIIRCKGVVRRRAFENTFSPSLGQSWARYLPNLWGIAR